MTTPFIQIETMHSQIVFIQVAHIVSITLISANQWRLRLTKGHYDLEQYQLELLTRALEEDVLYLLDIERMGHRYG